MNECYCVVYWKGRIVSDHMSLSNALSLYSYVFHVGEIKDWRPGESGSPLSWFNPAVDIFIECLVLNREIHLTFEEGQRYLDIIFVSG